MAGLDPAIHGHPLAPHFAELCQPNRVDARVEPGHDGKKGYLESFKTPLTICLEPL
jgi:hypothetical protein